MSKNTALDLNDHLFAELERLGDEDLQGDDLKMEVARAKAVAGIGMAVINNQRNILKAEELRINRGVALPRILNGEEQKKDHPVFRIAERKEG